MESFEDLGLGPELVEALSSEGMEEPTPFQAAAIPVIRRGNNLLGRAAPGAGTLVAYGAGLLDRIEPGSATPRALVVAPSTDSARELAEALAGLAAATGHVVAAAGSPWALPQRADILFGTATELLAWARANRFDPNAVDILVVDQAAAIQRTGGLPEVEALLAFLPKEGQRVILALPMSPEVEDFVERHARRAVQIPPKAVEAGPSGAPQRGEVRYRIVEEPKQAGALQLVSELLEDARHCCLFFGTEDGAADVGDYLTLHGYASGAPGDVSVPVWLAVRELAARAAEQDGVVPVSYDVPAGPDSLDRRHGGGRGGMVVVLPREMAHLRDVAKATGYKVVPFPPTAPTAGRSELDELLARLEAAGGEADLSPYLVALEPLFARRGAAEVAAAAVALLRQRPAGPASAPSGTAASPKVSAPKAAPTSPASGKPEPGRKPSGAPTAFVRLYVSLGERDDVGPGDIVGAVAGESGISGSQIGKIDIRDTFSIIEVQESAAEQVIQSLNGVTVRGRSVRVDYDRARPGGREARGPRGDAGAPRERAPMRDRSERAPRDRGERPPTRERSERAPRDRDDRSPSRPRGQGDDRGAGRPRGPARERSPGSERSERGPGGPRRDSSGGPPRSGPRDRSAGRPAPTGGPGGPPRGGARGADDRPPRRGDTRGGPGSSGPGRGAPGKGGPYKAGPSKGGPRKGGPSKGGPRKGGPPSKGGPPGKGGPRKGGRPPRGE